MKNVNLTCTPCQFTAFYVKNKDVNGLCNAVAKAFEVSDAQIKSKSRIRQVADARKAFFYIGAMVLDVLQIELAKAIFVHHTTAIYHVQACKNLIATDKVFKHKVQMAKQLFINNNPILPKYLSHE